MGRYKSVEIKGLFFDKFDELFHSSLISAVKESELSEEEIIAKLAPEFDNLVTAYEDTISSTYLEHHKFKLNDFLKSHFKNQKTIATTNKNSIIPFHLYINGCAIAFEKITERIGRKRIDSTLKTNVALYGLVIRRADEIANLLLCGHIDGAMIIWRSLYENAIILMLLATENDPELADKFYKHSIRNSKNKVASFNKHYKKLGFKKLPKSTDIKLEKETESLKKEYGKDFLSNDFGWADDLFPGKQKANFRLIEDRVEMSKYRPYYLLCCEQMHSNFNGFKNFMEGSKIILPRLMAQEIDLVHFIDPMQFTLSILHDINDYMLYEFSTPSEYEVNLLLLEKIFEKQQKSFDI
ncbi:DUF5677 domain-containing protein [Reichenbachiella sp. 5M10]|uniref:DUF5677 domain-containing protein n=1 Tax=Reichenbachiella sp. 5M10 TaxID=1889772 RepID=UPI00117A1B16|nr:DUF5677 domain-containing protein [Reichenbachiella sp. 5M10]